MQDQLYFVADQLQSATGKHDLWFAYFDVERPMRREILEIAAIVSVFAKFPK